MSGKRFRRQCMGQCNDQVCSTGRTGLRPVDCDRPASPSGGADAIKFCIVGSSPLAPVFKETVQGKSANGRRFVVLESASLQQTLSCNIGFVSLDADRLDALFRRVGDRPILTVGDDASFAMQGGMIGLTTQQNKVRFEVNMIATRRAGLKLGSQLLK